MTRILRLFARLCLAACLLSLPARAAEFTPAQRAEIVQILRDALKQDPSILRDAVTAMQTDEGDRQRAALAAAKDTLVDPADPVGGNPKGDVTIVEFFDTRCPYCRKLEPTMADLLARDHGVRLVYKDLPILGPASVLGSKALLAAQSRGATRSCATRSWSRRRRPPRRSSRTRHSGSASTGSGWSVTWTIRRSRRGSTPT